MTLKINIKYTTDIYQYLIFVDDKTDLNLLKNNINNNDYVINIIEFNKNENFIFYEKLNKKINYVFFEITNENINYKNNRVFGYSILYHIFIQYKFNYDYLIIETSENNFDKGEKYLKEHSLTNLYDNIETFIINLDERKDRWNKILLELNKINLHNFNRFSAIKINNINYKNYNLINPNKAWKKNNFEYIKSASGCKLSHLEILKKYKDCDKDYIMIIEDDAIFENNTLIYLNMALFLLKNIEWNILFLSTNLNKYEDAEKIAPNLLKINNGLTTTAQIFNIKNISYIINIIENSDIEIDNTYNEFIENKYCVYPMCVYQDKSYSDINKKILNYGKFHQKFIY